MFHRIKSIVKRTPVFRDIYRLLWKTKKTVKKKYKKAKEDYVLISPIYKVKYFKRHCAFLVLTPDHNNIGDHAIAKAEIQYLKSIGVSFFEIPYSVIYNLNQKGKLSIFNGRKILFTGGGYLGTLWWENELMVRAIVRNNPRSKIVFLPNTVYYESTEVGNRLFQESLSIFNAHKDITVFLRESISYDILNKKYNRVFLVPDMALSLPAFYSSSDRNGCILVLRSDREKTMSKEEFNSIFHQVKTIFNDSVSISDMCTDYPVGIDRRDQEIDKKMEEFSHAELVITDRLHGMLFCAITQTPCIAIESKSTKLRGCYEWIKDLGYIKLCNNTEDIADIWDGLKTKECIYDNSNLLQKYEILKTVLKEK